MPEKKKKIVLDQFGTTFDVDTDVPVDPTSRRRGKYSNFYTSLEHLDVGDSFFIPNYGTKHSEDTLKSIKNAITNYHKKSKKRFTMRSYSDGSRFWRIK